MQNTFKEQVEEKKVETTFKEQWEAKKLLKRAKKKAKHALENKGFGRKEATKAVNGAVDRIVKRERKSTGRGR